MLQYVAFEVDSVLVLCAENTLTLIPADDIRHFNHLAIVSVDTPRCGFCNCMNRCSSFYLRVLVIDMYSCKWDTTHKLFTSYFCRIMGFRCLPGLVVLSSESIYISHPLSVNAMLSTLTR